MRSGRPRAAALGLGLLAVVALTRPAGAQDVFDVVRGLWVTRWEYSTSGDVTALLSRAADFGMTDVFFQVRGRGDAFYRSNLEPWGEELAGGLGRDPGWDPLEVAIREAHVRGLRLHAWINTFPMWSGRTPPPRTQPEHIYLQHPGWMMVNMVGFTQRLGNRFGYVSASPANPKVQEHIQAVVMDIIDHYQVDGVHFDYIRLPDHDYSYDAVSRGRFLRESVNRSYMKWQADEITGMLKRISEAARARRPGLILTAAIVNRYNRAVGIFAQDPVAWTESGALDYVIPMMYTPSPAEFVSMMNSYREVLPAGRIAAGINLGEMPDDPVAAAAQVQESILAGIKGHVLFSMEDVDRLGWLGSRYGNLYSYMETLLGGSFAEARQASALQAGEGGAEIVRVDPRLLRALTRTAILLSFVI
ncbi:MAG: family 10 glycosylhydrolase [Candidatus Latescibacteria bacterium]|nr:family 10 glycosylhydrolase [Candidatus Latescibacterota bacterium]